MIQWFKSLFSDKMFCQMCEKNRPKEKSAVIKVRYADQNNLMDFNICGKCADILEQNKHGKSV